MQKLKCKLKNTIRKKKNHSRRKKPPYSREKKQVPETLVSQSGRPSSISDPLLCAFYLCYYGMDCYYTDLIHVRCHTEAMLITMKHLQQSDGRYTIFMPIHTGAEKDIRFVSCAASISSLLNNWSGMDMEKAEEYIVNCQLYDGGFWLVPGLESHVAAPRLMGFIEDDVLSIGTTSSVIDVQSLLEWCLQRQAIDGGFQGRANKATDTCYASWIGGILRVLGDQNFYDNAALREFVLSCQSKHVYFGFAAFCLLEDPGLSSLCIQLGIMDMAVIGI
ncbi:hypothetical protein MKW98_022644 [Papaver atlanticum]|uniref:Prenyltransferase alpha-alpha toroid domain-containing protein n=1 Tax=Papaver atlanticum TaxID=357466 RepID=A0AAD4XPY4_9MAGN|nr:hypothetical protein MKW98_022644 [Papaver atlanticum]